MISAVIAIAEDVESENGAAAAVELVEGSQETATVDDAADTGAAAPAPASVAAESVAAKEAASTQIDAHLSANALTADGQTYTITVAYNEAAGIPEDATLSVREILPGTDEYQSYLDQAAAILGLDDLEAIPLVRFFDIEILDAAGNKIEPAAAVSVKIELADAPEAIDNPLAVIHFEEDGQSVVPVVMEARATSAATDDTTADIRFQTESFSTYGILVKEGNPPTNVNSFDGWSATLQRDGSGNYVTAQVVDGNKLGKTSNEDEAAVWTFEFQQDFWGWQLYYISTKVDGEDYYMYMNNVNGNGAAVTIQPDTANTPKQAWAVFKNRDSNTYSIYYIPSQATEEYFYYLNEYSNSNGFAGWRVGRAWWGEVYMPWQSTDWEPNDNFRINFVNPTLQRNQHYAVIVEDEANHKFYAVQADGNLVEVEYDEETGRARVKLEEPLLWHYTTAADGLSDDTKTYNSGDYHPTWDPDNLRIDYDARGYNSLTQLPEGDYFRYISPYTADGIYEETPQNPSHTNAKYGNGAIAYDDHKVMGVSWNGNAWIPNGLYVGVNDDYTHIRGNADEAHAAKIHLALVEDVPTVGSGNETVSHIDIAAEATARLEVPLAYGKYYDKDGNLVLEVPYKENKTLNLVEFVDIDHEDIMNETIYTYDENGNPLDNAFYITGYTANDETEWSFPQVRMDGSFKVTTLDPYDGWRARSNDDFDRRHERLKNKVWYELTVTKDVTFPLTIYDKDNPVENPEGNPLENGYYEYAGVDPDNGEDIFVPSKDTEIDSSKNYYLGIELYGANGKPISVTVPDVEVGARFNYWSGINEDDEAYNECPPTEPEWERDYPYMIPDGAEGHYGRNHENWADGAIIDNNNDTSYLPYGDFPPYPGDSGMDFVLDANIKLKNMTPAVEVMKIIEDTEGNIIHPSSTVENDFHLFYNATGDPESVADGYAVESEVDDLADKQAGYTDLFDFELDVGTEGTESYYDYDVKDGMYYIQEESAPMADGGDNALITDVDGRRWLYKETRVETEYVWRADDYTDMRHSVDGFSGVPEALGDYEFPDWEEKSVDEEGNPVQPHNSFLEFYVHNVYELVKYPVYLKKVAEDGETVLAGAEFDVYGPYAEAPDNPKQKDKLFASGITTDEDGVVLIGEIADSGLYYLYETKAPKGYVLSEDPIVVTAVLDNDGVEGASVIAAEGGNVVGVDEIEVAAEGDDGAADEGDGDGDGSTIAYQITVSNPAESEPEPEPEPEPDLPQAGDGGTLPLAALSLVLVAAGVAAVTVRRRFNRS